MAVIPKSPFPNVPKLPGVPQVPRSPNFPAGIPPALGVAAALGSLWQSLRSTPQWGIYDKNNNRVIVPDSFYGFDYMDSWQISDFPTQGGSFANYNKVASPFEITVRLMKGGSLASRSEFLETLRSISKTVALYKILTPERSYLNCNIQRCTVPRQGPTGANFLAVDVSFKEIRQVSAQYSTNGAATQNAQQPDAQPSQSLGNVLPATPAPAATFDPATSVGVSP